MQTGLVNRSGLATSSRGPVTRVGRRSCCRVTAYLEEKRGARPPTPQASNQLEALRSMSVVVADTGEVDLVKKYKPVDCTTNPSLVYKAVQLPGYQRYLQTALKEGRKGPIDPARPFAGVADYLSVLIGMDMLQVVPGRVSTEVDAHLSYDTNATYDKALHLIDLYSKKGVDPKRIYIKMAATWEGMQACKKLQQEGIDCNMTLLFSFGQAAGCADAGAALISPFVGRILDWYKASEGRDFAPHEDPGVASVHRIYKYYKAYQYKTIVMAASFRNIGEIRELAGCDNITIAPSLLAELEASTDPLPRKLWPDMGGCSDPDYFGLDYNTYSQLHTSDQMAVDKISEGIKGFAADQRKLEEQLAKLAEGSS